MKKPSAPPAARLSSSARMVALLKQLAPQEGYTLTALAGVRFLRSDRPLVSTPVLYEPGIVIVCQGRKRGLWADQVYLYDAQHYLAVSVPVPFTMETDASADEPLLAIYFSLDLPVLAALALQVDELTERSGAAPLGMFSTPMDDAMAQTVLRFLEAMSSPVEAVLLGPAIVREIYFRVLIREQGASMRAALAGQGQFGRIAKAVRRIHASFGERLTVTRLAREAGMSIPTFHAHFRSVTQSSPMQYLKSVRLHQARLLMLRNGKTASAASLEVGYESASQFSREFKRFFGLSPGDEVARLKSSFAMPPLPGAQEWVSSH
ncbi:AraC family transcriptional regulator [Variovorax boronicumulans]|uniref:AraC family transcriptional regulator n=1 Tax=Variovorax boronicumulans TaxID=436515 RepID=UPI002785F1C5|nr:AraC family transcriptional regulator [Variovorax boronicumulans]MDQ0039637.1 AraC-like DNA-binding protein [Variovorax boronicumulans]